MAYKITKDCIGCAACVEECKNQAISEVGTICVIDPDKCTECIGNHESPRCAEICPVGACVPDPDHRESKDQLLEKWRTLHPREKPAYVS